MLMAKMKWSRLPAQKGRYQREWEAIEPVTRIPRGRPRMVARLAAECDPKLERARQRAAEINAHAAKEGPVWDPDEPGYRPPTAKEVATEGFECRLRYGVMQGWRIRGR